MNNFASYLIAVNIALILFMGVYGLLLRNEHQFLFNRLYLLGAVLLSFVFPLAPEMAKLARMLPVMPEVMPEYWLPSIDASLIIAPARFFPNGLSVRFILAVTYFAVAAVHLASFIFKGISLLMFIRSSEKYQWKNCIVSQAKIEKPVFSFFNFIFLGDVEHLLPQEKENILEHERVHVNRKHSFDVLLVSLASIVCWFNPVMILYRRSITRVHEYAADAVVMPQDIPAYCELMTKIELRRAGISLSNHFHNSLTIKRINMMKTFKQKIQGWKIASLGIALPVIFLAVSCHEKRAADGPLEKKDSASIAQTPSRGDRVYNAVENQPEFPGGMDGMRNYFMANLHYPADAKAKGVQGKVYVKFIVEKDGSITNAGVVKGIGATCDAEALRAVNGFPKWTPGIQHGEKVRTAFVVPINYKI